MPTFAEYAQVPSGTPVVGLQGVIQKAYEKKPFGRGHFQNALAADSAGGQMMIQVVDGPDLYEGMPFQASAHQGKVNGQPVWEDCYVEDYNGKRRITIKRKCFTILAGGQPPAPAQPAWGVPPTPPPASALAPGGPLGLAYGQAQPSPPFPGYPVQTGSPAISPSPSQPGRRPDPAWATDPTAGSWALSMPSAEPVIQVHQPPPAPAWQPKPKMTVGEVRVFLLAQFVEFTEALGREWSAGKVPSSGIPTPLAQLPPEVVAGAMAWSTSVLIAYQRGDVVDEPTVADGGGQEGGGVTPEELNQTLDIQFGG